MKILLWFHKEIYNKGTNFSLFSFVIQVRLWFYCRNTFEHICQWEQQCQTLYNDINEAVKYLDTLHDTYTKVSYKTNSLYRACEQLLADQTKLLNITECIENRLSYFDDVDRFSKVKFIKNLFYLINKRFYTFFRIFQ